MVPEYIAADLKTANRCLKEARAKNDEKEVDRSWARLNYLLDRVSEMREVDRN